MKHAIWHIYMLLEALFYIRNGAFSIVFFKSNRLANNNVIRQQIMTSATITDTNTTTKNAEATPTPTHKKLHKQLIKQAINYPIMKSTAIAPEQLKIQLMRQQKICEKLRKPAHEKFDSRGI